MESAPAKIASNSVLKRATTCALAASASMATASSEAAIVYTSFESSPLTIAVGAGNLNLDFDGNSTTDVQIVIQQGWGRYNQLLGPAFVGAINGGPQRKALVLSSGFEIDATDNFASFNGIGWVGQFGSQQGAWAGNRGYIGVQLNLDGLRYGWIDYSVNGDMTLGTVYGFAYEDSGAPILAGAAVPEPATTAFGLGLLALGAAGVREHRRRRVAA